MSRQSDITARYRYEYNYEGLPKAERYIELTYRPGKDYVKVAKLGTNYGEPVHQLGGQPMAIGLDELRDFLAKIDSAGLE